MSKKPLTTPKEFYAKDRKSWRAWLQRNHTQEQSVWLIFDKGPNRTLSWEDIVQESLCFGWIDSKPGKVSATQSKIYVSKRKPKSVWSKINKEHIKNLIAKKQMTPAGLAAIQEAKRNGSWDILNKSDALELPSELSGLLQKNKKALDNFNAFSDAAKRTILEWIYAAKTEPTKRKRILETVAQAAKNLKANQYTQSKST